MSNVAVDAAQGTAELRRLFDQGKDRGFITYDEITESLPQEELDTRHIDELIELFAQAGIESSLPRSEAGRTGTKKS